MKITLQYAERQARFWVKKANELRLTSNTVKHKEKGKGKENFPPAPPIEKRESQEKAAATATHARVRVRVGAIPPTRDESLNFAKTKNIPPTFVDYWLDAMETRNSLPWYDDVRGQPVVAWRRSLLAFWSHAETDKTWQSYQQAHEAKANITPRTDGGEDNAKADEVFANFWSSYPAGFKVDMPKCRAKLRMAYLNAGNKEQFVKDFTDGLHRWLDCERWERGVVCNSYTWLSQERWNDHPTPSGNAEAKAIEQRKIALAKHAAEVFKRLGV